MKRCNRCKQEKPLELYNKRLNVKGINVGTSNCKECVHEVSRAWKKAHPERTKEHHTKSKLKNIERVRA